MTVRRLPNGRWEARERAGGRGSTRLARTFDRKSDAERWSTRMRRQRQLGVPLDVQDVSLAEFAETYERRDDRPPQRGCDRQLGRPGGASDEQIRDARALLAVFGGRCQPKPGGEQEVGKPCKFEKADARIRTGDPFITRAR